jgi:cell wall-associated NlpC family hydrolase
MTSKETRAAVVKKGLSRKGKNSYTQESKRVYVGGYPAPGDNVTGFSDCSSFVRWCYLQVCGVNIGSNTAVQIVNKNLTEVCGAKGGQPADPSALLPGDLLYYKGGNLSRPYQVGHVEMYIGNGRLLGHGSGIGPKEKDMKAYNLSRYVIKRGLIKVLRYIPLDGSDTDPVVTPAPTHGLKVTASSLNVRKLPSMKGGKLGVVKRGTVLTPNGKTADGWRGVTYKGADAWLSAKYVEVQ